MKLGFFTNAYRNFPFDYALKSITRNGYTGIELWAKGDHITPFDPESKWRQTKDNIAAHNLDVYAISAHLDFVAPDKEKRAHEIKKFLRVLRMAKFFDVPQVHTASGGLYQNISFEEQEKNFLEAMEIIGSSARDLGLKLGLEPEPEKWLSTPEQCIDLIENKLTPGVFGVVIDTGHAFGVKEELIDYFRKLLPYLVQIHFDDVKRVDFPHRHLIPGDGDINYEEFFAELRKIGFDGWLSMELNRHNENPDLAAQRARQFMDQNRNLWQ